jgi:hypothetical protein
MAKREYNDLDVSDEVSAKSLSAAVADEQSPLGPSPFEARELPSSRPAFATDPVDRTAAMRSSPRETEPPTMRRHRLRDPSEMPDEVASNRMGIDRSEWPDGFSLQWITRSVFGQEQPTHVAGFYRRGWEPVHAEDFDGRYEGRWTPPGHKGPIEVEGMMLVARDARWTKKAEAEDKRKAQQALAVKEAQIRGGVVEGISEESTKHPSALGINRVRKSMERIPVPRHE